MPPEQPLLTIAIPTYNRAGYLQQLLDSLAPQLKGRDEVELIISDNASEDETQPVVDAFRRFCPNLRYIRNETNIGPDNNFFQCFEQASGRYVWIIGDDDIILPATLSWITKSLAEDDYDLVYLTPIGFRDLKELHRIPTPFVPSTSVYTNPIPFARRVGTMFTLISCNIINKNSATREGCVPFRALSKTNLVQLSWTYPALKSMRRSLFFSSTCLAIRGGTSGGYSISRVFGNNLKAVTETLLPAEPELRTAIYRSALRGILPLAILQTRRQVHGDFRTEDFDASLRPIYGRSIEYWLWVYPIARAPLWLASTWYRSVRIAIASRAMIRSAFKPLRNRTAQ